MMRRNSRTLLLLSLTTLVVVTLGLAFGSGIAPSVAAEAARQGTAKTPPTIEQFRDRAALAAKRASTALTLSQRQESAASSAEASLRLAQVNLASLLNLNAAAAPLPPIAAQQLSTSVATAQSRLSLAQQSEMQAELRANTPLPSVASPATNSPIGAILDQSAQLDLQRAREEVASAQRDLTAAQQAQASGTRNAAIASGGAAADIRSAQIAVETAQRLAVAARRAASAATLHADQLAALADAAQGTLKAAKAAAGNR